MHLFLLQFGVFCFIVCPGLFAQVDSFQHDGRMRYYLQELPSDYNPSKTYSLLLAMHGGGGNVIQFRHQSQLSVKAEEAGFILVYPQGVRNPNAALFTWNAGACCGYAMEEEIDDVGFIDRLLDTLLDKFAIDATRVFATGLSNGGFMAYRLACELPERIAAIAPVECSMNTDCDPELSVPIIHFHSYLDSNIPIEGGIGDGISDHYNPPLDSVLNAWSGKNDCQNIQDTVRNGDDYDLIRWSDCHCDAGIDLYITHDGGHSWPGGMQTNFGDPPSEEINANDRMWAFFQMHSNCTVPVATDDNRQTGAGISIFPNPVEDQLTINCLSCAGRHELKVYDMLGRSMVNQRVRFPGPVVVDCSEWPGGVYFVRLYRDKSIVTAGKLMKTRVD